MAINRQNKAELLHRTVKHIDITAHDPRALIDAYKEMSFSARELGRACELYELMLQDRDCAIILTVAGSTSAAGCMQAYVEMVRHNMVDIVVATGATVVDMDFFEALGFRHYSGSQFADDAQLRDLYIDRIYDTFIDEEELQHCDRTIKEIADTLEPRPYSSREFIGEMGRWLAANSGARDQAGLARPGRLRAWRAGVLPGVFRQQRGVRAGRPPGRSAGCARQHRFGARLPRADRAQAAGEGHRPLDDRRRLAQELRPGYGGVRRDPRPRRADAQVQRADHRGRRARRRLLQLDPQGGELLGQGRRIRRADGVRGSDARAAAPGRLRLSQRQLEEAPQARAGRLLG